MCLFRCLAGDAPCRLYQLITEQIEEEKGSPFLQNSNLVVGRSFFGVHYSRFVMLNAVPNVVHLS
jgi:hypothetical protein